MHPTASASVSFGIIILAVIMGWVFIAAQAFASHKQGKSPLPTLLFSMLGVMAWMGLTGALAASGLLLRFDLFPPPFALLFVLMLAAGFGLGFSRVGTRVAATVPLPWLVLSQGFRLPLELVMHRAALEGTMPAVMSYSGYNLDIVSGISAIVVAFLLWRGAPLRLARAWNMFGSLFLTAIIVIAFLSSPMVRFFGDHQVNIWVAFVPFVWLPTILVTAAIYGHVVVWRRLELER